MITPPKWFFRVLFLLPLLPVVGCETQEEIVSIENPARETLRIGLLPERNIFSQMKRYKPLSNYLSERVGVNVELKVLSRYGNVIENFVSGELDGAFLGSFTGALAQSRLDLEPMVRAQDANGTSTYHGLIFVRRNSGISNGHDMKGMRFAFVDKATTAGWLLPLYYFRTQGIEDYRSWLGETYFTGTHADAIFDVLDGKADIGAAKNTVFYMLARSHPRITDELMVLARSPDVPENALCVRKNLDATLKQKINETLLKMDQDGEGKEILKALGAARFIPTGDADFEVVFAFAAKVGLNLEEYDYMDE